ncbi:hypothetical protein H1230_16820 [Paenibacillus sp. 19GGS1-52]|uniref:hypothetical protein n=1 Tax=Paenibacillus sp. 19GGS1-52 TaxID=2758563 RepID=UPI001EFC247E|nr:hypothetical protein [Paenibacillus sp. 19GGS1-52]ULO04810.1 hypothetical protein H1230_16820 [Paenibacillus sp. 19GGS1-52]
MSILMDPLNMANCDSDSTTVIKGLYGSLVRLDKNESRGSVYDLISQELSW